MYCGPDVRPLHSVIIIIIIIIIIYIIIVVVVVVVILSAKAREYVFTVVGLCVGLSVCL